MAVSQRIRKRHRGRRQLLDVAGSNPRWGVPNLRVRRTGSPEIRFSNFFSACKLLTLRGCRTICSPAQPEIADRCQHALDFRPATSRFSVVAQRLCPLNCSAILSPRLIREAPGSPNSKQSTTELESVFFPSLSRDILGKLGTESRVGYAAKKHRALDTVPIVPRTSG